MSALWALAISSEVERIVNSELSPEAAQVLDDLLKEIKPDSNAATVPRRVAQSIRSNLPRATTAGQSTNPLTPRGPQPVRSNLPNSLGNPSIPPFKPSVRSQSPFALDGRTRIPNHTLPDAQQALLPNQIHFVPHPPHTSIGTGTRVSNQVSEEHLGPDNTSWVDKLDWSGAGPERTRAGGEVARGLECVVGRRRY